MLVNQDSNAGLIHDIRNMFTTIVANCSILAENVPPEKSLVLSDINEAVFRLSAMIDQLSGRDIQATPRSHISTIASESIGFFSTSFPEVQFFVQGDADATWQVHHCDMSRIVMNLVINAATAAIENPERLPQVTVSIDAQTPSISVIDSGYGFRDLDLRTAMLPFVSVRENNSRLHDGLGLHIVNSIAESYGGSVDVHRTNHQTIITVRFPHEISNCPYFEPTLVSCS